MLIRIHCHCSPRLTRDTWYCEIFELLMTSPGSCVMFWIMSCFCVSQLPRTRNILSSIRAQTISFRSGTFKFKYIDKPESKSQSKVPVPNPKSQIKKGKGNLDSGLSLKSYRPPPHHPQLLGVKEATNKQTQQVKVTLEWPPSTCSEKKQMNSNTLGESLFGTVSNRKNMR